MQETKLEYNETQLTSLLDQVIVHLESKSCTNQLRLNQLQKMVDYKHYFNVHSSFQRS